MAEAIISTIAIVCVAAVLGFGWTLLKGSSEDWDNEKF